MNYKLGISLFFFFGLLLANNNTYAQLVQRPVDRTIGKQEVTANNARILAEPLSLPFWDDFSSGKMDSTKWQNSGANVSLDVGINAPTIGVLLLDGSKANGQPYSTDISQIQPSDQVSSQPIDLSSISRDDNSLYLSFFWQMGGKADVPDLSDYLSLQFLDSLGIWQEVWKKIGGEDIQDFQQELIAVNPIFRHQNFQFKFTNSGRLAGPFDTWLIDYVYLNAKRSDTDLYYQDRALTGLNSTIMGDYAAMPWFEFNHRKDTIFTSFSNEFYNLNNRFRAMEYSMVINNKTSDQNLFVLNNNTPFNPVPLANERREFTSNAPGDWTFGEVEGPFDLESLVYLSSGDNYLIAEASLTDTVYYENVDFRVNDTIRTTVNIQDFYAYDRGTVDYAAGINQRSGMLAIKYETSSPIYLNAMSINFTNDGQTGTALDLLVWGNLEEDPILVQEIIIQPKDSLDQFTKFAFDSLVQVNGEFYIGYIQYSNDFIDIGLDKSNNTSSKQFYNVLGEWQASTAIEGSLMIRAHAQLEAPAPAPAPLNSQRIKAFPNPVTDQQVSVEGEIDQIKMFDAFGREININVMPMENGKIINFTSLQKGVYLLKAWNKGQSLEPIRILVK
ncbi:hypothetical protein GCM10007049_05250 [Echinicola pacifica]|uniref:Secretion system C-terminal sorting domain-containing protein n=1 Tax=Echinicola pacifica TaxID=346377 RepID=A0A918PPI6_9BACT|nr:T9SS type A sorting domain-containing protein [Echinicola pacifica]GGZ15969.1 hypothetical protein GCM10007049_05250 [Echinicola pacifica]